MTYEKMDVNSFRVQLSTSDGWKEIRNAEFEMTYAYSPENGVLIVDTESASVSLSYVGTSPYQPVESGDRIRMRCNGRTMFEGQVDSTSTRAQAQSGDPGKFLYEFSATLVGKYAAALIKVVTFDDIPDDQTTPLIEARTQLLQFVDIVDGA